MTQALPSSPSRGDARSQDRPPLPRVRILLVSGSRVFVGFRFMARFLVGIDLGTTNTARVVPECA